MITLERFRALARKIFKFRGPAPDTCPRIAQPQQALPPDDPDMHEKTFTGVVVKSGDKVVLLDTLSKTSYQLDDQQKAKSFLNKSVRVTGVLNPATGTIHVSAIDPV